MTQEQFEKARPIITQLRLWEDFRDQLSRNGLTMINGLGNGMTISLFELEPGCRNRAGDEILEAVDYKINELKKQLSEI